MSGLFRVSLTIVRLTLAVACIVSCGIVAAQSSAQYTIAEFTFDRGGLPAQGLMATSASFVHGPSSIGDFAFVSASSPSFSIDGGFTAAFAPPGEVRDLRFDSTADLTWRPSVAAGDYQLYRGSLAVLGDGGYGDCLATALGFTSASDDTLPVPGGGFFYLVTVTDRLGERGTKGSSLQDGVTAERGGNVCP